MYTRVWTVRFSDTDPHGIAHYPRIVDAVHETSDMFMEEIGWPLWQLHGEGAFGLPIAEAKFTFERPLVGGNQVTVGLTPELGNRSVRFTYEAYLDDDLMFSAYEQRVCVETEGHRSMPLPDQLRTAMEPYTEEPAESD